MFLFSWQSLFKVSDVGLDILIKFFAMFIALLVKVLSLPMPFLRPFIDQLPHGIGAAKKFLGYHKDDFTKYAVCPSCHSIYNVDDCKVMLPNKSIISAVCDHIEFPNHPHKSRRKSCHALLMKSVRTSSGSTVLYPRLLYCYKSVAQSLQNLLMRPGFIELCEKWRCWKQSKDVLADVYDGKVWQEFQIINGMPFLSLPYNYAFSINVDWYQPFKRTQHSTGVIYLAVQNLPRSERFKRENIIIVGIIPGPHEPSKTVNSFLYPLVEELKHLWSGIVMNIPQNISVVVRAALICVACDIPAARKVCGFVSHNALLGCSKCLKPFPTASFGEKPNYSGFDRDNTIS